MSKSLIEYYTKSQTMFEWTLIKDNTKYPIYFLHKRYVNPGL